MQSLRYICESLKIDVNLADFVNLSESLQIFMNLYKFLRIPVKSVKLYEYPPCNLCESLGIFHNLCSNCKIMQSS